MEGLNIKSFPLILNIFIQNTPNLVIHLKCLSGKLLKKELLKNGESILEGLPRGTANLCMRSVCTAAYYEGNSHSLAYVGLDERCFFWVQGGGKEGAKVTCKENLEQTPADFLQF